MVVADAMKCRMNRGKDPHFFFLRTEKGFEIDRIIQEGRSLTPVEIKSAATFNAGFIKGVKRFCESEPAATSPMLIYDGESYPERDGVRCINFREMQ